MDVIIRQARKEEASQIAELFMLAWPVDEILGSIGLTCEHWNSTAKIYTFVPKHFTSLI